MKINIDPLQMACLPTATAGFWAKPYLPDAANSSLEAFTSSSCLTLAIYGLGLI